VQAVLVGVLVVFIFRVFSRHFGLVADWENWGENAMRECRRGWRAGRKKKTACPQRL